MKKADKVCLLCNLAKERVAAISKSAMRVGVAPIGIDDGNSLCIIYEDKQRLYLCECYMYNDEARCNLRLFKEV